MLYNKTLSNTLLISNLKSYLTLAEDNLKLLEQQNNRLYKRIEENAGLDDWSDESSHLNNIDWLLLNSIYVTMYSSFEHFLFKVTQMVESKSGTRILLKHFGGHGILEKYVNYIFLVGGLSSADKGLHPWDKITQHQNIRNLLVHNGGIMMDNIGKPIEKHKCYSFLKTNQVTMLGSLGMIRICNLKLLETFVADVLAVSKSIVTEYNIMYK